MKTSEEEIMKEMDEFFKSLGYPDRPDPIDVMTRLDELFDHLVRKGILENKDYDGFIGGANAAFLKCKFRR